MKKNKLLKYLQKERIRNLHLINSLIIKEVKNIYEFNNSYLIEYVKGKYSIYGNDKNSINKLLQDIPSGKYSFSSVEDWIYDILEKRGDIIWNQKIYRFHLPDNIYMPNVKNKVINLTKDNIDIVNNTWPFKSETSINYIGERMQKGPSSLIMINNEPAAWGMLHNNGAIGFLYTQTKYRRKGYAKDILIDLSQKVRESNNIPFLYTVAENINSINLSRKLSFTEDGIYYWTGLKF